MKLILRGHQLKLTESLKDYANQKLLVPLEKLIKKPATKLTVDLSHDDTPKDNVNKKCRVRVSIPHLKHICISELDENTSHNMDMLSVGRHGQKPMHQAATQCSRLPRC